MQRCLQEQLSSAEWCAAHQRFQLLSAFTSYIEVVKVAGKIERLHIGNRFSHNLMHDTYNQNIPFFFSSQASRKGTNMTSNKSWSVTSIRAWTEKMETHLMASSATFTLVNTCIHCRYCNCMSKVWQVFLSELYRNTLKLFRLYRHTDKTVQLDNYSGYFTLYV